MSYALFLWHKHSSYICSICIVRSAFQVAAWIIVSLLYLLQAPIWEGQGGWREACVSDRPLPMLNPRQDLLCFLPRSFWPRIFFSKMYKKRCEDGRNPSMRGKEMRGGWGQENHLRREEATAGTPAEEAVVARLEPWRRRSAGGGTPARPRGVERARRGRGLLPGVCRPGAIPRGYWAHSGRKPPCSGFPNMHAGLRAENFRVGCRPGETTGIPAGKWASKLALRMISPLALEKLID